MGKGLINPANPLNCQMCIVCQPYPQCLFPGLRMAVLRNTGSLNGLMYAIEQTAIE